MASSGNPITHAFGVTAFGGGGGHGALGEGAGSKRPLEDNDDSNRVIKKASTTTHPERRRLVPRDSVDSDSDDSDIGEPTSRWSPNRGLVALPSAASASAANLVPLGPKKKKKKQEKTTITKTEPQEDSSMTGLTNGPDEREIVEISSDEEENDNNSDEQDDEETPEQPAESRTKSDNDQALQQAQVQDRRSAKQQLRTITSQVPEKFWSDKNKKSKKEGMLLASVRYIDHLNNSNLIENVLQDANKTNAAYSAMMSFFHDKYGQEFARNKKSKFKYSAENLKLLINVLDLYFKEHGVKHVGRPPRSKDAALAPEGVSSRKNKKKTATSQAPLQSWSTDLEGDEMFINELPAPGPAKRGRPARTTQQVAGGDQLNASHAALSTSSIAPTGSADSTQVAAATRGEQVSDVQSTPATSTALVRRSKLTGLHNNKEASQRPEATDAGNYAMRDLLNDGNGTQSPSDTTIPAASDVSTTVGTLKLEITAAMRKPIDWSNVPVALFETEMSLKRLLGALERAKDAVAKSTGV